MLPSTKRQRQLIGIACGQLGIDRETKKDMLLERYGMASTTEIGKPEADDFLKELVSKGFVITSKKKHRRPVPRGEGNTVSMVSPGEREKIKVLAGLIEWEHKNGFSVWMKKRIGIGKVRTGLDAYRVIEGLKKMFENGMKQKYGEGWWVLDHDNPKVKRYIEEHCPLEYR